MSNPITAIRDYVAQSVAELKKVSWPSRDVTLRYSVLVIAISIALAAFFATLDFGLRQTVNVAFSRVRTSAATAPLPDITPIVEETPTEPPSTDVAPQPSVDGTITLPPINVTN